MTLSPSHIPEWTVNWDMDFLFDPEVLALVEEWTDSLNDLEIPDDMRSIVHELTPQAANAVLSRAWLNG